MDGERVGIEPRDEARRSIARGSIHDVEQVARVDHEVDIGPATPIEMALVGGACVGEGRLSLNGAIGRAEFVQHGPLVAIDGTIDRGEVGSFARDREIDRDAIAIGLEIGHVRVFGELRAEMVLRPIDLPRDRIGKEGIVGNASNDVGVVRSGELWELSARARAIDAAQTAEALNAAPAAVGVVREGIDFAAVIGEQVAIGKSGIAAISAAATDAFG